MIQNKRMTIGVLASASLVAAIASFVIRDEGTGPKQIIDNETIYTAYPDPSHGWKVPTICNGRTRGVFKGMTATQSQCELWLQEELSETVLAALQRNVKVPVTKNQAIALARFVDNVGEGTFRQSQLLRNINNGKCKAAAEEWDSKPQLEKNGTPRIWTGATIKDKQTGKVLLVHGDSIKKFTTAGGIPLPGLIKRRANERAQWEADCDAWSEK